jgi:hypothetical protein
MALNTISFIDEDGVRIQVTAFGPEQEPHNTPDISHRD